MANKLTFWVFFFLARFFFSPFCDRVSNTQGWLPTPKDVPERLALLPASLDSWDYRNKSPI